MLLRNLPIDEQRLLIRAQLAADIPAVPELIAFLRRLGDRLGMQVVSDPLALEVDLPEDMGRGVHVHLNWAESGADIYTWEKFGYLSLSIHTCKVFNDWEVIREFVDCFRVVEYQLGWAAWGEPHSPFRKPSNL
ncbi:MAG: hypothetical protein V3W10_02755 [candidate division NC10 bacterium]|jgi:hypothetical protein